MRDSGPVERLIDEVAFLAQFNGGAPYHNSVLIDTATSLRNGQIVDWEALVKWSKLAEIRADLDLLPQPARRPPPLANRDDIYAGTNVFRRDGKTWTLAYKGWMVSKPLLVGLFYIRQLLDSPRKPISVTALRNAYALWCNDPSSPVRKRKDVVTIACEQDPGGDEVGGALYSPEDDLGDELDSVGRQTVARRIKELDDLIMAAKIQGKTAQADDYEGERQYLEQKLNHSKVPGGGTSKLASVRRNVKNTVCTAIRRALRDLQEAPLLYQHLARSVKIGTLCCYAPETPTSWNE